MSQTMPILRLDSPEPAGTVAGGRPVRPRRAKLRTSLLDWKQKEPEFAVYEGPRLTQYLGGWIRHSGCYPNMQRRLYQKNAAHYEGVVHETLVFEGKTGRLEGALLHYTIETFGDHEAKVESYSTLAAADETRAAPFGTASTHRRGRR